jgi:primosomal protein N'
MRTIWRARCGVCDRPTRVERISRTTYCLHDGTEGSQVLVCDGCLSRLPTVLTTESGDLMHLLARAY